MSLSTKKLSKIFYTGATGEKNVKKMGNSYVGECLENVWKMFGKCLENVCVEKIWCIKTML